MTRLRSSGVIVASFLPDDASHVGNAHESGMTGIHKKISAVFPRPTNGMDKRGAITPTPRHGARARPETHRRRRRHIPSLVASSGDRGAAILRPRSRDDT